MSNYEQRVTVADILRREGLTDEFPAIVEADDTPTERIDDTPTDRIPVVELLHREGRWNRRRTAKVGAVAAGVAALAGLAVTVFGAGNSDDNTISPLAGGTGGGAVVDPSSSSVATDTQLLPAELPTTVGSSSTQSAAPDGNAEAGSTSTSAQAGSRSTAPHRDRSAPARTSTDSSSSSSTTTNNAPSSTTSHSSSSGSGTSATTTSPSEQNTPTGGQPSGSTSGGPIGPVLTGVGGVLGGLFGHH